MATPITHIVLANKLADVYFPTIEKDQILIWTSLPDIRYITNIPNDRTHLSISNISQLDLNDNPFNIWFKLHSLVDNIRDRYYESKEVYKHWGDFIFISALKILEDKVFYNKISNRDNLSKLLVLNEVYYENLNQDKINKRYSIVSKYIFQYPTDESINELLLNMWFNNEIITIILQILVEIEQDTKLVNTINSLYENLDIISNN